MSLADTILFVYTTRERYNYAKILKSQLTGIDFLFVYHQDGKLNNDNLVEPYILFEEKECYENLPLKTYNCLNYFLKTNKEFFIKMNDDCVVDIKKLDLNMASFRNYDIIGKQIKNDYITFSEKELFKAKHIHYFKIKSSKLTPKQIIDVPYVEGSFYILSRNVVTKVISKFKKQDFNRNLNEFIGEDMTMGMFLNSFKDTKILDITLKTVLDMDITKDFISIHPTNYIFMEKIFKMNDDDKLKFLSKIQFCNEYVLKDKFLEDLYRVKSNNINLNN
jgi:hypothetical protein